MNDTDTLFHLVDEQYYKITTLRQLFSGDKLTPCQKQKLGLLVSSIQKDPELIQLIGRLDYYYKKSNASLMIGILLSICYLSVYGAIKTPEQFAELQQLFGFILTFDVLGAVYFWPFLSDVKHQIFQRFDEILEEHQTEL